MVDEVFDGGESAGSDCRLELALPYSQYVPPHSAETVFLGFVTLLVAPYLRRPEIGIGLGQVHVFLMAMPETAVYEYDDSVFTQHYIGRPRQTLDMLAVAVATRPQPPPHYHLRLGILALDAAHAARPLLLGHHISHNTVVSIRNRPHKYNT